MHWSHNTQWLLWLAGALASGLIEIATVDFLFLMIAGGALIAGLGAAVGVPVIGQALIFAAASGGLLGVVRPPMRRWARNTPTVPMNVAALVGQDARVLETVSERTGLVKLAGQVWTARVDAGAPSLEVGSDVQVVRIDGATAMVTPNHVPPGPQYLGR